MLNCLFQSVLLLEFYSCINDALCKRIRVNLTTALVNT